MWCMEILLYSNIIILRKSKQTSVCWEKASLPAYMKSWHLQNPVTFSQYHPLKCMLKRTKISANLRSDQPGKRRTRTVQYYEGKKKKKPLQPVLIFTQPSVVIPIHLVASPSRIYSVIFLDGQTV